MRLTVIYNIHIISYVHSCADIHADLELIHNIAPKNCEMQFVCSFARIENNIDVLKMLCIIQLCKN